ncbi:MAG: saccharopine dehydrogenase NADP-binding domain-containing protein [Sphingomonas sp.]|uniref:saccharopine dehydrogenase family protein n=1 Tax=Sphingomonas sp. TaxID=28214 RepID=UPI001797F0C2|nr:saccharopine dehydrogenase NADP-binding domain-containing protein [Sphingomonas sp.]MBA3666682.1 saccharopine dehydrogenase NADP-binding domain-containing protein [Sphingomonas sp.]
MRGNVTVYGAYGHTGRFVVAELKRRGWTPVLSGRDPDKLNSLGVQLPDLDVRVAALEDSAALDRALSGSVAVINCAGPFAETVPAVVEAALRSKIHYLDIAAEIEANLDTLANYGNSARDAGIVILPAMAFFGGLGDLLATAAIGDWPNVDEISIAYGLASWHPTAGTRAAGKVSRERRGGRRIAFANGRLEHRDGPAPVGEWTFPQPLGRQRVVTEFTMADAVTIPHHIPVAEFRSYMTVAAVSDVIDPSVPPPIAADDSGRSSQTFIVDVVARLGSAVRRAVAGGRDIYAVSAPIVVEALGRLLNDTAAAPGVYTAGEIFDARGFLEALSPQPLSIELFLEGQKFDLAS